MAHTPFQVEILTPEGEVFSGEVEMLSTRTTVGSIGILAKHQPMLAMLEPAELRLYRSEDDVVTYAQGEGYIQVTDSGVLVLVDDLLTFDQLDVKELQEHVRRAKSEFDLAAPGSEAERFAAREMRRYEAFLGFVQESHVGTAQ